MTSDSRHPEHIGAIVREVLAALRDAQTSTPTPLPTDRLWTSEQAALYLSVSERYLRDSSCPRVRLPGNGSGEQAVVRFDPAEVKAWEQGYHTLRAS